MIRQNLSARDESESVLETAFGWISAILRRKSRALSGDAAEAKGVSAEWPQSPTSSARRSSFETVSLRFSKPSFASSLSGLLRPLVI